MKGEIPPELDGAFYRVQPDPQFPPLLGDDIAFNGDGMITMFRFEHGRVDFRSAGRRPTSGSSSTRPARRCSAPIATR